MRPTAHALQAAVSGAALYPVIGMNAVPFALAVVLIDLDHLIEYLWDTRDFTFRGFFVFYDILLKNWDKNYLGLNVFHTVEFYLFGALLAQWRPVFYVIIAGCVFHHVFDIVYLSRLGIPFAKASSVMEYLIRRKRYRCSIRDILRHEAVNLEGIPGAEKWALKWGLRPVAGGPAREG